ncbi:MAG: hypothetical protein HOB05_13885 [Bacteroidetes bacterium]|jgi:hypothetical protein|nr:hypothetical protein [Bacteroidota bacterium]MBT6687404.1 hypothetical protein [Bacteroidota bacterium]MBT7142321.1 hypothetical protein [Bacteroidota bacterium]
MNTVHIDSSDNHRPICRISFVKNDKDLYFIDKSNDNFHISIHHPDGNVSLTFQNDWKYNDNIRLFKYDWDLIEEDCEFEKPMMLYFPAYLENYLINNKQKSKSASMFLQNVEKIEELTFKFLIMSPNAKNPKSRKADLGVNVNRITGEKDTGENVDETVSQNNPSLRFDKHRIRFSIGKINKSDELNQFKLLFLFQPTIVIDMEYFIANNSFEIDFEKINQKGFFINNYLTKNKKKITLLAYK